MASIINATTTAGVAVTGDNSGALALQTNNGTTAVTIDTSQNVGVGTASPDAKLKVVASGANLLIGFSGTQNYFDASENIFRNFSGTERMRIDSSGRVTMPFQVSFSAIANAVQNTTIPFGNAATYSNVGSGLNTSTGVFTAPVAGTYLFTTNTLSNGGQADMQLSINGVYRASCRGNNTTASMSLIYTMAAGDTARVVTNGVQAYGDSSGWSIFNGRLIG